MPNSRRWLASLVARLRPERTTDDGPAEGDAPLRAELLSGEQLEAFGRALAASHQVTAGERSDTLLQRLAAVFEWILFRANEHLGQINAGLGLAPGSSENYDAYNKARDAYIAFLKDLDDREPQERGRKIVPGKSGESGYGKAITVAAAAALRELGSSSAIVCTPSSNAGAVATYASAGFQPRPEIRDLRRDQPTRAATTGR